MHLDSARHFIPTQEIRKVIEEMSLLKMNLLHWHLSDDQGWRIESKLFPLLHEQCAGEYYTQEELRETVEYARVRGVDILPEIDMPGHTTSVLAAYPQYSCTGEQVELAKGGGIFPVILCAGKDTVFEFLEKLLSEIIPLFPYPWFHIGGDEAPKGRWNACPDCTRRRQELGIEDSGKLQGYFTNRVCDILKEHGKHAVCWNDALSGAALPEGTVVQYWTVGRRKETKQFVKEGGSYAYSDMFDLYFDYPCSMTPLSRVYKCRTDLHPAGLLGYEACLWTESVDTPEKLERRLFPRIAALAEKNWSGKGSYRDFLRRLESWIGKARSRGVATLSIAESDPKGQDRRRQTEAYLALLNANLSPETREGTMADAGITLPFLLRFVTKFLHVVDLPVMGALTKKDGGKN
jgi:hexosaminidase